MSEAKDDKMIVKNGQIKVTQDPKKGLKKLADSSAEEYGVDDLIEDSEEGGDDVSSDRK